MILEMIILTEKDISYTDIFIVFFFILVGYIVNFYINVYRYPKGPFPIPFIGSFQVLLTRKEHPVFNISKFLANYGALSTIWIGNTPIVYITDLDLMKKAFSHKHNAFMGRAGNVIKKMFKCNSSLEVIGFSDPGPNWAALRKAGQFAIRKLVSSKHLPIAISEIVDNTMMKIKSENSNKFEFDPSEYIQIITTKISAFSSFGISCFSNDEDFQEIMSLTRKIDRNLDKMIFAECIPILSLLQYKTFRETKKMIFDILKLIKKSFKEHSIFNDREKMDSFCNSLMNYKQDVICDGEKTVNYLNEEKICTILLELFMAGTGTTKYTMYWIFLSLANFPEMQQKIRDEISRIIGDRIPEQEDIKNCHFTQAFITEVLRLRNVTPNGFPHQSICDAKLGNYYLPKGTIIVGFLYKFMHDTNQWKNPEIFYPDRFLINGKFDSSINSSFVPFGSGKRMCIGGKYFQNNAFLILVRSLQATKGLNLRFLNGRDRSNFEPRNSFTFMIPKMQKMILDDN